eukprot:6052122-Karenia_brevis.AAC.1
MQTKHHMKSALLLDVTIRKDLHSFKDLYSFAQAKHQMKRALFLAVVVGECAAMVKLLTCKDKIFGKGQHASTRGKLQMK